MRIAIIGTPRSGNTAMRSVLAAAYELTEMASHDASFLRSDLPDNTIAQVHCAYDQGLRDHLRSQDIDIVTPRRHPLDTLLSMLHFAQFEPQVATTGSVATGFMTSRAATRRAESSESSPSVPGHNVSCRFPSTGHRMPASTCGTGPSPKIPCTWSARSTAVS